MRWRVSLHASSIIRNEPPSTGTSGTVTASPAGAVLVLLSGSRIAALLCQQPLSRLQDQGESPLIATATNASSRLCVPQQARPSMVHPIAPK